ncbi:MAG: helix-turn-helix domain-containing protein [Desulfocucumaceae bacterium]
MLKKIIGINIRSIRKLKGYSQNEAAQRTGFTPSYWGYLERGQKNPSIELLERIAEILDVEPYILLVDTTREGLPPELLHSLNIIKRMGQGSIGFISNVAGSYIKTHS